MFVGLDWCVASRRHSLDTDPLASERSRSRPGLLAEEDDEVEAAVSPARVITDDDVVLLPIQVEGGSSSEEVVSRSRWSSVAESRGQS